MNHVTLLSAPDPGEKIQRVPGDPGVDRTRWQKGLLKVGSWVHPSDPARRLKVTPEFLRALVANFNAGRRDRTPLQRRHSEDWQDTVGTVEALSIEGDRLVATVAVDDSDAALAIARGQVTGVSAGLAERYVDKRTGKDVGPTLLHVALTNSPYIGGLSGFAALSDDAVPALVYLGADDGAYYGDAKHFDEHGGPPLPEDAEPGERYRVTTPSSTPKDKAPEPVAVPESVRLRNPDLTDDEVADIGRLAALAAERSPARYDAGPAEDDVDDAIRLAVMKELTPQERMLREDLTPRLRTQFPRATDAELDEIARITARAERFR